jgi:hypothetical protein
MFPDKAASQITGSAWQRKNQASRSGLPDFLATGYARKMYTRTANPNLICDT